MSEHSSASLEAARWLLDIKAVNFRPEGPYTFTAGWASPVYIDCRWVISFTEARRRIIELGVEILKRDADMVSTELVAGGETAGIPYVAWIAEVTPKPMLYVRKKPKGFGRGGQIEGNLEEGKKALLVEDLASDGGSKINFVNALRTAGEEITDIFVVFFYGAFPKALDTLKEAGVGMHYLCTLDDVLTVAEDGQYLHPNAIESVREFLFDPVGWSAVRGRRNG